METSSRIDLDHIWCAIPVYNNKATVASVRALIGKKPDDELTLVVPGGKRSYQIVEILY